MSGDTAAVLGGFVVGFLLVSWLVIALVRAADKPAPTPPPARPQYRCNASTGRAACTAPATRIVMLVTGPTEMRVMCDQDAQREVRIGRAVDLGPISGGRA